MEVLQRDTGLCGFRERAERTAAKVPVLSPSPTLFTDAIFPEARTRHTIQLLVALSCSTGALHKNQLAATSLGP